MSGQPSRLSAPYAAFLKSGFDVWLLTTMLFGAYTFVYLGTLYLYSFYKKTPRSWILIASITVAYTSSAVMVGVGWSSAKMVYIGVVQALEDGDLPSGPDISYVFVALLNNFCIFAISTVADGLLINDVVTGLFISSVVLQVITFFRPSPMKMLISSILLGASYFLTFTITIVNTGFIAYRVTSFSRVESFKDSRAHLRHIILILVESSTAYSVVSLANAIVIVIPLTSKNQEAMSTASSILSPLYLFVAGIAPTIMAARVFLASGQASVVSRVSTIQFRPANTRATWLSGRASMLPGFREAQVTAMEHEGKGDGILHIA
ncbi:hypothetical protein CVT26_008483 [Gymnopilus dilepis]|uniref:Uncharacterized protein n=1 Tax=Gymnopilus dilepis TaxID=231916 RepID=A0A409XXG7_9AGAR|nr:hypothetical protein CVT26_008483 [Gymnopilus dilepis]